MAIPEATIQLGDTDEAEIPQDVVAAVTLTNLSEVQQNNIHFNGMPTVSFHNPSQAMPVVPVSVTLGPTGPALASLAPGQQVTEDYDLHVTNNGVFDVSSQVLSVDAGGTATNVSTGLGTITVNPTALLVLSLHRASDGTAGPPAPMAPLTTPGAPVLLSGTLVNRSQTKTIDLTPVLPTITGDDNAGSGELFDASESPLPDGVRLPVAGDIVPGKTIDVEAEIDTAPVVSTRANVIYAPDGYVVEADGSEDAADRDADPGDGRRLPDRAQFRRRGADGYLRRVLDRGQLRQGRVHRYLGVVPQRPQAGENLLLHPVDSVVHFGVGAAGFVVTSATAASEAARLLGALYMLNVYYEDLTPEKRHAFIDGIVSDYNASTLHTGVTAIQNAADPILTNFANALATGDFNTIATMAGTGVATGAGRSRTRS